MVPRARIDKFIGNEFGRTKYARRVNTMDGIHQLALPKKPDFESNKYKPIYMILKDK